MNISRWEPCHEHSWPYRVFNQYNAELNRIIMSFNAAKKYTYSNLKKDGAKWADEAIKYLYTNNNNKITIREWSDSFNLFTNWIILNEILAISSYFETYIASIISLSFESDPGLLIGSSHSIDGIKILKDGFHFRKNDFLDKITGCTKGQWSSRISNINSIFGQISNSLTDHLSELEKIRILRNKVGHAFGRDIELSRDYSLLKIEEMEILKPKQFIKYQRLIKEIVCEIDLTLMKNHIGNFQPLFILHKNSQYIIQNSKNDGEKMMLFKKFIGKNTEEAYSKDFCRWAIKYYNNL